MNDLEKLRAWLQTYPGAAQLADMQVDYTESVPGMSGVFPDGLTEVRRETDILGNVTVYNQYHFALRVVFAKSPGDDVGASANANWVMAFQRWVQEQSLSHKAPTFGNAHQYYETMSAQNGALIDADEEGFAVYLVQLTATFKTYYTKNKEE